MTVPTPDQFARTEDYYEAVNAYYAAQVDVAEWGDRIAA